MSNVVRFPIVVIVYIYLLVFWLAGNAFILTPLVFLALRFILRKILSLLKICEQNRSAIIFILNPILTICLVRLAFIIYGIEFYAA